MVTVSEREPESLHPATARPLRPLALGMRRWLWVDSFLVLVTGIQCFLLADFTAELFAWTISPPLTAAFLGASYWAAFPLVFLSARERAWAHARVAVYGVLVFTTVTLAATLLHLDRFHLASPQLPARVAAWAWMVVYVLVPPSLLALLLRQQRVPGRDPERTAPLPNGFRLVLVAQATVLVPLGIALVLVPPAGVLWPWALTPLTARAVGAWLLGMGITFAHAAWENDWPRLRAVMVGYACLGALQLVALLRYAGFVKWERPTAWLYVLFLGSILVVGLYGWRSAWRPAPPGEPRRLPGLRYGQP